MKKKIVISEFMDETAVAELQGQFDVLYDPLLVKDSERLKQVAADAQALIVRNQTQVNQDLLAACQQLVFVGRLGVGLDNIDLPACKQRGIKVQPATGANSAAVAEYVIGTAMLLLRGAYLSSAQVAAGQWPRARLSEGREIGGKTLGLIGFGSIGREVASRAQALGMTVVAFDPAIEAGASVWAQTCVGSVTLEQLLSAADMVSLHVPLTADTRNLLSAQRIAALRPGAVVINTARGGILDEAALAQAIRDGRLGGAAIDVFEHEPLPDKNVWSDCPNVVLTPHIGGVTLESNQRVSSMIATETARFLGEK